ncbi:hypothetical protein OFM35_27660, partial [Escherichia coli]|nr:hypothetical protein [Escherichia coli]
VVEALHTGFQKWLPEVASRSPGMPSSRKRPRNERKPWNAQLPKAAQVNKGFWNSHSSAIPQRKQTNRPFPESLEGNEADDEIGQSVGQPVGSESL